MTFLPFMLRDGVPSILQTLLARMRETVRVCTKEPKPSTSKAGAASTSNPNNGDADRSHCNTEVTQTNSASKRQEGSSGGNAHGGGWKSTSNVENGTHAFKPKGPKVEAEGPVQIVERVEAFVRWLSQVMICVKTVSTCLPTMAWGRWVFTVSIFVSLHRSRRDADRPIA